ncbi:hypothetical protein HALLA_11615 [Halostagnicola larsenii XH-48]|uniref:DUF8173 domain-containing protein n=2 Tax=Halostagnicola larsenii TaxID=353800 RepID=W0JQM4_9EURY|nr:hypothetical protein HALLA_11615 [Halostagnicola larsenii XH-48]
MLTQSRDPTLPIESLILAIPIEIAISVGIGALVLAIAPQTSQRTVDRIWTDPGTSFLYGLLVYVLTIISVIALVITVIGLLVVIPGIFVFVIVVIVGNVLAVIAVGTAFAGESNYWLGLVIGAVVVALLSTVPVLGEILRFIITTTGLGAFALGFSK